MSDRTQSVTRTAARIQTHDDLAPADLEAPQIDLKRLTPSAVGRLFVILFHFIRAFAVVAAYMSLGRVIMSQLEMLQQLGTQVDKGLMLRIKQVMYFERYGKQLAPEWKLAKDLYLLRNLLPDLVAEKAAADGMTLPH